MFDIDNRIKNLEINQMKKKKISCVCKIKNQIISIRPDFKLGSKLESFRYIF